MTSVPVHRPLSPFKLLFRLALLVILALFLGAVSVRAQLVTPRTVPVFQDEQFNVVPTSRPGLANSFIALEDTLGDPFVNPAKATRLRGVSVAASPYTHHVTGNRGGGQTFPVALYAAGSEWAGAVLAAYQNLERAGPTFNRPVNQRTSNNQYVTVLLARRIGSLSVGASASHAGLEAIDGVDLLYAGSDGIEQHGSVSEYRLGVVKELGVGHSFELLGMHNRTDMTHDVHFTTWTWDPVAKQSIVTQRQDQNLDQTHIWGVHSRYYRPVGTSGWRIGGLVTANRLSHPKIPNYVLQNIPRDPGDTYGYNLGLGAGRLAGPTSFFVDLVIEPMRSETWADLARDTVDVVGTPIAAGAKTIENSFNFHNSKARVGAGHVFTLSPDSSQTISVDAALSVYTIGYGLRQTNNIARTTRYQAERWAEMSQSVGVRFRTRDIEVSYAFRRTCGNQGCGEDPERSVVFAAEGFALASAGGIIAAPSAPLFLQSGVQSSHRFGVAVPIR
jgi:hypothetical protein